MSFEYPFFLIIPIVYLILKYFFTSVDDRIIFPNTQIFSKSKNRFSSLEFLIILFLGVALASPVKSKILTNTYKKGYNIVIDLDTSGSMAEFNKIDAAKAVSLDFAKKRKSVEKARSDFLSKTVYDAILNNEKNSELQMLVNFYHILQLELVLFLLKGYVRL
jgi:hypothetical protein